MVVHHVAQGASLISGSFADDPAVYYILGTAYAYPDEPEPTKGRILVLQVRTFRIASLSFSPSLVSSRGMLGGVPR